MDDLTQALQLSTMNDLRQRRQKAVISVLKCAASNASDKSYAGDADSGSESVLSVSAAKTSWFYWLRISIGLVLMLVCAWVYASYVKQLHETHLWFSNIQVR